MCVWGQNKERERGGAGGEKEVSTELGGSLSSSPWETTGYL